MHIIEPTERTHYCDVCHERRAVIVLRGYVYCATCQPKRRTQLPGALHDDTLLWWLYGFLIAALLVALLWGGA